MAGPTILRDDPLLLRASAPQVAATLGTARRLGVDWVRVTAAWSAIAPAPHSGRRPTFDAADPAAYPRGAWARLDRVARLAARRGLALMVDVTGPAPRWAIRPRGIDALALGRFASAVARRYSGRFHRLPAAVAFAIWDEPNSTAFLRPQWRRGARGWSVASADQYRAMVYASYPAIKRVAPRSLVLLGNTAAAGPIRPRDATSGVAPLRFVRALACVSDRETPVHVGSCARFRSLPGDGWAHQPYSGSAAPWRRDPVSDDAPVSGLARLAALLRRLHAGGRLARTMPIYVTGYGYRTNPPDPRQAVGLYRQARWLGEAEWIVHRTAGVRGFAQSPLRDPPPGSRAGGSGLELPDATPKPAMAAFAYTLVVHYVGPHHVTLWGRVRPRHSRGRFRIAVRRLDPVWRPLPVFNRERRTDEDGYFAVEARTGPGGVLLDSRSTFRLELMRDRSWRPAGLPIFGAQPPASG
ncbi:MAG: hypothetical protein ACJ76S_12550 [Solirubrobacteraceae bacterium]